MGNIVYIIITAFCGLMSIACTALVVDGIMESEVLILTLFYLALAIFFWFWTIMYIYMIKKDMIPEQKRKENRRALINELCNFARSDNYVCIDAEFRIDHPYYSSICFKTANGVAYFYLNKHGYADISEDNLMNILKTLEKRLDGYLKIYYKEVGGYDDTITVTEGFVPGGGTGYYVSSGGYGTANVPTHAYLFLGENAKKRRLEDKRAADKRNGLKEI